MYVVSNVCQATSLLFRDFSWDYQRLALDLQRRKKVTRFSDNWALVACVCMCQVCKTTGWRRKMVEILILSQLLTYFLNWSSVSIWGWLEIAIPQTGFTTEQHKDGYSWSSDGSCCRCEPWAKGAASGCSSTALSHSSGFHVVAWTSECFSPQDLYWANSVSWGWVILATIC